MKKEKDWKIPFARPRVTPELAAQYLNLERLHTRVLVNQCDTPELQALACRFAAQAESPVCIGALQKGWLKCLF